MKSLLAAVSLTLAFGAVGVAQQNMPPDRNPENRAPSEKRPKASAPAAALSDDEREVISKLHAANQREIAAGKLAVERGQTAEIRKYGQSLIDDHTAADRKLKNLAKKKDLALTESESAAVSNLKDASSSDFDRVFVSAMIKDHDDAIDMVKDAQEDCKDKDVLAFLRDTLPVLQRHREMAQRITEKAKS